MNQVTFVPNPLGIASITKQPAMGQAMAEVAEDKVPVAKALAPVRTGAYADSIHVEQTIEGGDMAAMLVADVDYAVFVEFGTSDTPTFAPLRRALEMGGG